jgi:hypothetical protein
LENHYYGVIETREFHKEKLRFVRIRNVWGPEGGWNGAFYAKKKRQNPSSHFPWREMMTDYNLKKIKN